MELYFKDLDSTQAEELSLQAGDVQTPDQHEDTAEDVAFAELSDRVYAAGLVF